MTQPNHYELLGVMRNAPPEVIRGAYKALAQKYHPDKNPGDAEAARMMTALNRAALTLLNEETRRAYDEFLNGQAAASPEPPEAPEPDTVPPNPTEAMEEPVPKPVNWYSGWRLLITATLTVVLAKLVGIVGALVALPLFFWLQPKRGAWLALAVAVVSGVAVAVLYSAFFLPVITQQTPATGREKGAITPPSLQGSTSEIDRFLHGAINKPSR